MKISQNDITPESVYLNRRNILAGLGLSMVPFPLLAQNELEPNSFEDVTTYNNYYEFGTGKSDPSRYADKLTTSPWSVVIDGLVDNPGEWTLERVLSGKSIEERIYRLRCVEAWSMIVPWNGFELSSLLSEVGVKSSAKYVVFETLYRPEEMPGLSSPVLDWPYVEGLRLDEALHPLTILATGLYGRDLPNQNGAPLRLVVPWKYGFKSIKSIVRITLTDKMPATSWSKRAPNEYGFFANVNPDVDHPRWSQATERKIGGGIFSSRQDTLMFNGYEEEVAHLYKNLDLRKNF